MSTLQNVTQSLGSMTSGQGVNYTPPRLATQAGMGSPCNIPNNSQNRGQPSFRLKFHEFDGTGDVDEWLMRINHYFSYYNTHESDRIRVCSVQLKNIAAYWLD